MGELGGGILLHHRLVVLLVLEQGGHFLGRGEEGALEEVVGVALIVALVFLVDRLVDVRQEFGGHTLLDYAQHDGQHLTVELRLIVLVEVVQAAVDPVVDLFGRALLHVDAVDHARQADDLCAVDESLHEVGCRVGVLIRLRVALLEQLEHVAIARLTFGRLGDPCGEGGLFGPFAGDDVEVGQATVHTDGVLPIVGAAGILRGVLDAYGVAGLHGFAPDVLLEASHFDARLVRVLDALVDAPGGEVAVSATGEADGHRVILLAVTLEGDFGHVAGVIGLVVGAVVGRLIVGAGVDTEDGEVARVACPHPVVRIAAELTERRGRSEDESDVAEDVVDDEEVLVVIEGQHLGVGELVALGYRVGDGAGDGVGCADALILVGDAFELWHDTVGEVDRLAEVLHFESFDGQLVLEALRHEAVLQVVVLHAAELLDGAVAAMVVGEDEPLVGDGNSGASAAEDDDGVGYARARLAVDGFDGHIETQLLHACDVLFVQLFEHPHAFVGPGARGKQHARGYCSHDLVCSVHVYE